MLQVGEALAYAHTHNISHGNVKPKNILFDAHGQALLTDFTLVSSADAMLRDQISEEYAFCYMAPEQGEISTNILIGPNITTFPLWSLRSQFVGRMTAQITSTWRNTIDSRATTQQSMSPGMEP